MLQSRSRGRRVKKHGDPIGTWREVTFTAKKAKPGRNGPPFPTYNGFHIALKSALWPAVASNAGNLQGRSTAPITSSFG